jgi:uncharacterized protein (DUF2062 family)
MTEAAVSQSAERDPGQSWWRRWLVEPIRKQLVQGTSPEALAWATAVGMTIGIIPLMGTVSTLAFLVSAVFKLNQSVSHLFSRAMLPFHLLLILPFIQLGRKIYGAKPLESTIPEMMKIFSADPMQFARDFGLAAWHGFSAWALVAVVMLPAIRYGSAPIYRYFARKLKTRGEIKE